MRLIDADAFERRCMFDSNIEDMQDVIYALRDYSTIHAIPISVIEGIKADIKDYLENEKYTDDGVSDVGVGLELALNIMDRVLKEYTAT